MASSFDANHYMYSRESTLSVTCLSFGPNREVSFPEAFFCNECKAYEGDTHADPISMGKSTSRRYKCKGKHTDLNNPSNVGGQPMVYYASTQVGATFFAGHDEMPITGAAAGAAAGEQRGRSIESGRNQVPPARKRGVGATLDVLRSNISDLEVRVAEQNQQISALQLGNTETKAKLRDVDERAITASSELDAEYVAHAKTKIEWNEEHSFTTISQFVFPSGRR
jgi:hypothetical protein